MFGVSKEAWHKASREYVYRSRERQSQTDIFGFRTPEEGFQTEEIFQAQQALSQQEQHSFWSDRFIRPPIQESGQASTGKMKRSTCPIDRSDALRRVV